MTDTITSQNVDLSSWDTLYVCTHTHTHTHTNTYVLPAGRYAVCHEISKELVVSPYAKF